MGVKKPVVWWQNPQTVVSILVGLIAISSWVVNTIMADAKQAAKIEEVDREVSALDEKVDEHDKEIEQTTVQYQLIQQQLGVVVDTLKEMKSQR